MGTGLHRCLVGRPCGPDAFQLNGRASTIYVWAHRAKSSSPTPHSLRILRTLKIQTSAIYVTFRLSEVYALLDGIGL